VIEGLTGVLEIALRRTQDALAASQAQVEALERAMKIVEDYFGDDDPPEEIRTALAAAREVKHD